MKRRVKNPAMKRGDCLENLETICPELNALTSALAKAVYKDLSNDERLSGIEPHFEQASGVFYWSAQNVRRQQMVAYVPVAHSKDLDLELIRKLQQKLTGHIINIGIVENSGNTLYYRVNEGLHEK